MLFFWVGVCFLCLLALSFAAGRKFSRASVQKKKKIVRRDAPESLRTDSPDTERLNKRVLAMQSRLDMLQGALAREEKAVAEALSSSDDLRRQLEQEKNWQRREEDALAKAREKEKSLKEALQACQSQLAEEASRRIGLEGEKKDLVLKNGSLSQELYQLNALKLSMERQLKALTDEGQQLKTRNAELLRKKEAEQWVAKSDYVHLQKELRRLRARLENMKLPVGGSPVSSRGQEELKAGL